MYGKFAGMLTNIDVSWVKGRSEIYFGLWTENLRNTAIEPELLATSSIKTIVNKLNDFNAVPFFIRDF
jgi:hypothetical protein